MKGHCAITEKSHFPVFVTKDAAEGYDKAGDPSGTPLGFMPISGHPIQQSKADRHENLVLLGQFPDLVHHEREQPLFESAPQAVDFAAFLLAQTAEILLHFAPWTS